ncbi:MAG: peptide chain release factor N(5)-glutamine methyltransferase [Proteobacteria bacterium]|nr:peptide chain release factor N(5)-glutamine methyltransferase [Pseudomonadota bacterium]
MTGPGRASEDAGPWTVLRLIRWTTGFFESRGVDTPRLDAEVLLADLLGLDRVRLYMNFDRPLNADELAAFRARVRRRAAREPVAYITGRKEFYSLTFRVGPEVLVPRPETELLVEETVRLARKRWPAGEPLRILDLGTGCGAVAAALASELDQARIFAIDISAPALALARLNAEALGLADRIRFFEGDLTSPLEGQGPGFHLAAANLPYVPRPALDDLAPEVRREPRLALDGGPEGLDLIRRAATRVRPLLEPRGALLLEIWPTHGPALTALGETLNYASVRLAKDLAARDRVAILDTAGNGD